MKNVQIKNSRFRADTGITLNHVDGLLLDNVTIDALNGEPLTKQNGVTNLVIK